MATEGKIIIIIIITYGLACRESEEELRKVMKTVSDSFAECRQRGSSISPGSPSLVAAPPPPPPTAVVARSSSAVSDDSSSDLMEHFMSELDLVFSDILAEEVSFGDVVSYSDATSLK